METCETQEEPALHLSVQGTFLERTRKMSGNRKCQVRTLRTSPRRPGDELKGTLKQEPQQSLWKTSDDVSCLAVRLNTLPGQTVAQDSESHEFHHQRIYGWLSVYDVPGHHVRDLCRCYDSAGQAGRAKSLAVCDPAASLPI